ncbi:MAG: hypothetical protein FJ276_02875 [Planctomycetes bacterium]|nr:hypothetical protein [Planctomycetota bacterium]
MIRTMNTTFFCLLGLAVFGFLPGIQAQVACSQDTLVRLPTSASSVTVVHALPDGQRGADIIGRPEFHTQTLPARNGSIEVNVSSEPVWIIEGELTARAGVLVDASPFGFHPALAPGFRFVYAEEIGVRWHRPGLYLMWVLGQPDVSHDHYVWDLFDRDVRAVPPGMRQMRNLCVCHDAMIQVPNRPLIEAVKRPEIDVSQHTDGTTYRPKDVAKYQRWVRAVVERYDGDGVDDMPGLAAPIKYWQVDNEPPRRREGYADLVHITSQAVKEADATASVLIGGLEIPFEDYRERIYETEQLPILRELQGTGIDIVDLHWFGHLGEASRLPKALERVRKDLQQCGFENTAIWFTELGTYSGGPRHHQGHPLPFQSERQQAAEMLQRHVVALGEAVGKLFWAWGMTEGFVNVHDNDYFDNTGFVYDGIGPDDPGRGTKKIVYWTYQQMTGLLQHWDGKPPERLPLGEAVVGYQFRMSNAAEGAILLLWLDQTAGRVK